MELTRLHCLVNSSNPLPVKANRQVTPYASLYLTEANLTKLSGLFRAQDPYVTVLCLEGTTRELSEIAYVILGSVDNGGVEQETAHLAGCGPLPVP